MGMHEKASRKYYFSTKYSESMNTNNKLYAKAVVNQSRIYLQLSKAQCAIAIKWMLTVLFFPYASEYGEGTM